DGSGCHHAFGHDRQISPRHQPCGQYGFGPNSGVGFSASYSPWMMHGESPSSHWHSHPGSRGLVSSSRLIITHSSFLPVRRHLTSTVRPTGCCTQVSTIVALSFSRSFVLS